MARKLDPGSDRHAACLLVAERLKEEFGTVNAAAKAKGLTQQTLNDLVKHGKLGIDFADQLASLYETTVDGLVWLFLKGGDGAVRAENIPGWAKAMAEAADEWPDYPYELAALVVLPVAPRFATKELARDLAQFLYVYAKTSHARISVKKASK